MRLIDMFGFREDTLTHETTDIRWSLRTNGAATITRSPRRNPSSRDSAQNRTVRLRHAAQAERAAPKGSENTGNLIQLLWEATDSYEPEQTWMPKTQDLAALARTIDDGAQARSRRAARTLVAGR